MSKQDRDFRGEVSNPMSDGVPSTGLDETLNATSKTKGKTAEARVGTIDGTQLVRLNDLPSGLPATVVSKIRRESSPMTSTESRPSRISMNECSVNMSAASLATGRTWPP